MKNDAENGKKYIILDVICIICIKRPKCNNMKICGTRSPSIPHESDENKASETEAKTENIHTLIWIRWQSEVNISKCSQKSVKPK